jgi:hypothetical protein
VHAPHPLTQGEIACLLTPADAPNPLWPRSGATARCARAAARRRRPALWLTAPSTPSHIPLPPSTPLPPPEIFLHTLGFALTCKACLHATANAVWRTRACWPEARPPPGGSGNEAEPAAALAIGEADIAGAKVQALKDWLRQLRQRVGGTKAELQERLRDALGLDRGGRGRGGGGRGAREPLPKWYLELVRGVGAPGKAARRCRTSPIAGNSEPRRPHCHPKPSPQPVPGPRSGPRGSHHPDQRHGGVPSCAHRHGFRALHQQTQHARSCLGGGPSAAQGARGEVGARAREAPCPRLRNQPWQHCGPLSRVTLPANADLPRCCGPPDPPTPPPPPPPPQLFRRVDCSRLARARYSDDLARWEQGARYGM